MSSNEPHSPNDSALFEVANKLRGSVESAGCKRLVLGLIFLKHIADAFQQRRSRLVAELADPARNAFVEDPAERAETRGPRRVRLGERLLGEIREVARLNPPRARSAATPTLAISARRACAHGIRASLLWTQPRAYEHVDLDAFADRVDWSPEAA
jgi:hypothetical protein